MLARILAEGVSKKTGKIVLVSVFIKNLDEKKSGRILSKIINKMFKMAKIIDEN